MKFFDDLKDSFRILRTLREEQKRMLKMVDQIQTLCRKNQQNVYKLEKTVKRLEQKDPVSVVTYKQREVLEELEVVKELIKKQKTIIQNIIEPTPPPEIELVKPLLKETKIKV